MSILIKKKEKDISFSGGELRKFVNCILVSGDGFKFDIHEKLINQTQYMCNLFEDASDPDCLTSMKIFFIFCSREELKKMVQFLHDGKIHCENEDESLEILKNLKNLFGFSNADLECQKTCPRSMNGDIKESLENTKMISVAEEIDCEKTMCGDLKESDENMTMIPATEAMDCSPVKSGDIAKEVDSKEKKGLKRTGSKTFFVPYKPPTTPPKLVIDEGMENEIVMTQL